MIKTQNLSKIFATKEMETRALRKINLEIEKGEFVAIMGPSGCGKSTLLNILGLLDNPSSGEYYYNEVNVSLLNEKKRTIARKGNIGFVFQNFNLIDELTVFENVELPLIPLKIKAQNRKRLVKDVLQQFKIGHRAKHFPRQLSGGQQQRVAIARAIIPGPGLILADEPTGNLDSVHGIEVMKQLRELNRKGSTIVMVTHNRRDAEFAHRVLHMSDGRLLNGII
jgi:putative ABC transport system ATP-binding protein